MDDDRQVLIVIRQGAMEVEKTLEEGDVIDILCECLQEVCARASVDAHSMLQHFDSYARRN